MARYSLLGSNYFYLVFLLCISNALSSITTKWKIASTNGEWRIAVCIFFVLFLADEFIRLQPMGNSQL